jgi:cysteinyl-tRNA synthetase
MLLVALRDDVGLDLIFPHHENEIAQSRCAHDGAPLANYWVHNGFVDMGAEKMSKSLGNVITVDRLLADGWEGPAVRLALLSAHYRSPLPWTEALLVASLQRIGKMFFVTSWFSAPGQSPLPEVVAALKDDLNTPMALASISKLTNQCINDLGKTLSLAGISEEEEEDFADRRGVLLSTLELLGLDSEEVSVPVDMRQSQDHVSKKLMMRWAAKEARLFDEADRIRDELESQGVILMDFPTTTLWMEPHSRILR